MPSIRMIGQVGWPRISMRVLPVVLAMVMADRVFPESHVSPEFFGVWDRDGSSAPADYPFLKGFACNPFWKDVEQKPGSFTWDDLDAAMQRSASQNRPVYLSLGVGPDAPEWIYAYGVPRVTTNDQGHSWPCYPYYLSPEYRSYFERMIREFARKLRSYTQEQQGRIAFIQVKTGCTGDECPYKGVADQRKFDLDTGSPEWSDFRLFAFRIFSECFQDPANGRPIPLLFNNVTPDEAGDGSPSGQYVREWNWVQENVPHGLGVKINGSGRGHHLAQERTSISTWSPRLLGNPTPQLFARSEMDQTYLGPMYLINQPLNFYWGALTALQDGLSIWDVSKGAITDARSGGWEEAFSVFNRYAGQANPTTATAAFCALHKGLDAADTGAYPEVKYGKANRTNTDRMLKICADYSQFGAAIDDESALLYGQVAQRDRQKGLNDVGWDIWPGNYQRFISQIDPDGTSRAVWRIGGAITVNSSMYSRFARRFEHESGRDAMFFRFDDGFSSGSGSMDVMITWYDEFAGSTWKLVYDGGGMMKTALTVTGIGDRQWHRVSATIHDGVFRGGGDRGSDLALVNADDRNDTFSIIEVSRESPTVVNPDPPRQQADTGGSQGSGCGSGNSLGLCASALLLIRRRRGIRKPGSTRSI